MENETKVNEPIYTFAPILEMELIKKLNKILNYATDKYSEQETANKEVVAVMDGANVCMVIAKTQQSKQVLRHFVDKNVVDQKVPTLDYTNCTHESKCKFSIDYIEKFIEVFNVFDKAKFVGKGNEIDSVEISVKFEYPSIWENEHFKFILAPRINND